MFCDYIFPQVVKKNVKTVMCLVQPKTLTYLEYLNPKLTQMHERNRKMKIAIW